MDNVTDMACRELVELVSQYLDGELTGPERRRFDAHLAECPDCVTIVAQFRATIAAVRTLDAEDVPDDAIRTRLAAEFRDWAASRPSAS